MACQPYLTKTAIESNAWPTKYRIEKTNPYLKYFLNYKTSFCLSDFAKHLEKLLILQKNHMARSQTYALRQ